jgi:phospholipase/lecithinase/hemolysin
MKHWLLAMALTVTSAPLSAASYFDNEALENQKDTLAQMAQSVDADRIVVLGDSLSDTGRLLKRSLGFLPDPKYHWEGRFSNGPVWIDYVSRAIGVKTLNLAIAGSRIEVANNFGILPDCPVANKFKIPSGFEQLDEFEQTQKRFTAKDILMINLGANDYIFQAEDDQVQTYVDSLKHLVERSIALGAMRIAVFTLPEGIVYREGASKDSLGRVVSKEAISAMKDKHNALLSAAVDEIKSANPFISLTLMTSDSGMAEIGANPQEFGLKQLTHPCFTGSVLTGQNLFNPNGIFSKVCSNPRGSSFWDSSHPTTIVHCLSTVEILGQMEAAGLVSNFRKEEAMEACKNLK